ncbi:sensor histidine kinase [Williamsia sp. 1135]|uniref:sensor histidine kinase n=1 Tax=Williamsia sp. 1135 TaxID=1889262 RepID=UPI001F0A292B|nr:sensor histidine kinase [Williamsia sp. 1135]
MSSDTLSTTERIFTLTVLGCFALVYVLACVYVLFRRGLSEAARTRNSIAVFLLLIALAGAAMVTLGENIFALAPYLMAVSAFAFPLPIAVATCVFLLGAAILTPEIVDGWSLDTSIVVMLLVVGPTLLAVRVLRSREELREQSAAASRRLNGQLAVVAERERVARDVHDILGHSLTVMTVKSELAGRLVDVDPTAAKAELADLHRISREALAEIRATVGGLRSPDLATELLSARTALVAARIEPALPADVDVVNPAHRILFAWTLREAVTNVVRHSGATQARVTLGENRIEVTDNGVGLQGPADGNGLRGLRERVQDSGGTLRVVGDDGTGTTIEVTVS